MDAVIGYAVREGDGKINVKTVSETKRAAKVNWLVTKAKVWISNATADDQIERSWQIHRGKAECVRVQIEAF